MAKWVYFAVFFISSLCIAVIDFRTKKIPNILLIVLVGILFCIDLLLEIGVIPYKALAALGAYILFYTVYRFKGGLGYGDVKYAGVIGYFLGHWYVLSGLLCAVLFGLGYWFIGNLIFRWGKAYKFSFGPFLSCGAIVVALFRMRVS